MNNVLKSVLTSASELPETDQLELADQIEQMIIDRKVAAGEASFEADGGVPVKEAFTKIRSRLKP